MPYDNDDASLLREELFRCYKKSIFNKKELAVIMNVSLSYIDKSIARGYGTPHYKKLGVSSNSKVVFNIVDIANYFSNTTKML